MEGAGWREQQGLRAGLLLRVPPMSEFRERGPRGQGGPQEPRWAWHTLGCVTEEQTPWRCQVPCQVPGAVPGAAPLPLALWQVGSGAEALSLRV